jgi:urease accessory protein
MDGEIPTTFLQGLLSGLAHPIIGPDHLLFLLMAGVLARSLEFPMRFTAPMLFVVSALIGTSLHFSDATLHGTEVLIALSVITAGGLVIWQQPIRAIPLSVLLAFAGLFHGYAYAEAIVGSETAPLAAYLIGLALIQYVVIVATMIGVDKICTPRVIRYAGSGALLVGVFYLSF